MKQIQLAFVAAIALFALQTKVHAQSQWQVRHGLGKAAYQQWVNEIAKMGYRISYVDVHSVGALPRFSAIAVKDGKNHPWVARHDLTSARYQQVFDRLSKKGYRLLCTTGYPVGNTVFYATAWVKDGSPTGWQGRHGLTSAQHQAAVTALDKKGMRPVFVSGFPAGRAARFNAVFSASKALWLARHALTAAQYQAVFDKWVPKGYRAISVSGYRDGNATRYAAIFIKDDSVDWVARHALTAGGFQREFDRWTKAGYRLLTISGYAERAQSRYAAVWIRRKHQGKLKPGDLPATGKAVPQLKPLEDAMREFMAERGIRGGALAVSKNGRLVLARGFGWRDRKKVLLLGPDTPFRIASVSKPITAAAIWKLIFSGKLKLSAKAFVLLGILPKDADPRLKDITIDHLLHHRGGWDRSKGPIFDPMFQPIKIAKALGKPGPATAKDVVRYMAGQKLNFAPGSKEVYSNFGYCVLGRIIEKVSGKSYIQYVRQDLLAPLGIKSVELGRTLPQFRNKKEPNYFDPGLGRNVMAPASKKLVPEPDGAFHLEAMDAHGGLIASAPDLIRFLGAYWISGKRRRGNGFDYTFFGSLPGTWSMARQRPDGVNIVALFNQRSGGKNNYEIKDMMDAAVKRVKLWP